MNKLKTFQKKEIAGALLLLAIFILPIVSLAGGNKKIYVDADANGIQNGSEEHPYRKISQALKGAKKNAEVHISSGIYRENIVIPKGVEIFGSDKDKVIIKAKNSSLPAVKMNHKTEINKVTVEGGRYGIVIDDGDRASVIECIVKNNKKDGIKIKEARVNDKYKANIIETLIKDNGRSGIYSQKRRLVLIDNEIYGNGSDGIDIEKGSTAWIKGNRINHNDGSGLKLTLDGSEIWTKGNTYHSNEREGMEINAYGENGQIDINKSKFYKNDRYGITKIERNHFGKTVWGGLTIRDNNIFWNNKKANISDKIKI